MIDDRQFVQQVDRSGAVPDLLGLDRFQRVELLQPLLLKSRQTLPDAAKKNPVGIVLYLERQRLVNLRYRHIELLDEKKLSKLAGITLPRLTLASASHVMSRETPLRVLFNLRRCLRPRPRWGNGAGFDSKALVV